MVAKSFRETVDNDAFCTTHYREEEFHFSCFMNNSIKSEEKKVISSSWIRNWLCSRSRPGPKGSTRGGIAKQLKNKHHGAFSKIEGGRGTATMLRTKAR